MQVRTVILIALLAIVRKLMIMDMSTTNAEQLLALAAATLTLGGVYWLVGIRIGPNLSNVTGAEGDTRRLS